MRRLIPTIFYLGCASLHAASVLVTNNGGATAAGSLGAAILNALPGDTIDCSSLPGSTVISLTQPLPAIVQNLTFLGQTADGTPVTIDGGSAVQAFSIASGTVAFDSFQIQNCRSKGGNGGTNGGGGVGGGGGLYVHNGAIVTISNLSFVGNSAVGGNGGSAPKNAGTGGGGGGGFGGGNGGLSTGSGGGGGHPGGGAGGSGNSLYGTSGAGGGGSTQVGGSSGSHVGGTNMSGRGGGGAGAGGNGSNATASAAGPGGIGIGADSLFGGGGGGGGGTPPGVGVGAGGGGGSASSGASAVGANGGVLGGGGGGSGGPNALAVGGTGGFGAGGGGGCGGGIGQAGQGGSGGLYGGSGGAGTAGGSQVDGCGGGGAGLGGAIFVQNSGSLIINTGFSLSGNTATAGLGGTFSGANSGQNGQAKGADFFVRSPGSLTFNNADSLTISSNIESDGAATLIKQNTGVLSLLGTNTYTGLTSVNQGTLVVNGSIAGAVSVALEGVLKGIGTIHGLVTVGGVLSPGNSIGTINVDSLLVNAGGILQIEIDASGNISKINVTNGVTLDPNSILVITADPGTYSSSTVYPPFITASSFSGSFGTVVNNIPNLNASFAFVGTVPTLFLVPALFSSATLDSLTGNSANIGAYLNSLPQDFVETATYKTLTQQSLPSVNQSLETISPSRNSFPTFISINTVYSLNQILDSRSSSNRFSQKSPPSEIAFAKVQDEIAMKEVFGSQGHSKQDPKDYNFWVDGFGVFATQDAQKQNPKFHFQTWGFLTGFEVNFPTLDTGVVLAYAGSRLQDSNDFGSGSLQAGYAGIYATANFSDFYINGTLWNGFSHNQSWRHIFFSNYSEEAKSSWNVYQADGHVEFGYDFNYKRNELFGICEPFASLDYAFNCEPSLNEEGDSVFRMHQEGRFASMLRTEVGLNNYVTKIFRDGFFRWKGKFSYVNKVPFHVGDITAHIVGEVGSFSVTSFSETQNLFSPSMELIYRANSGGYLTLSYDGEFGSGYSYNQFSLKLGKYF